MLLRVAAERRFWAVGIWGAVGEDFRRKFSWKLWSDEKPDGPVSLAGR